jgi:hypothetical protein
LTNTDDNNPCNTQTMLVIRIDCPFLIVRSALSNIDILYQQCMIEVQYKDNIGMTFNLIQCIDITLWKLCYIDQIPYLKYEINNGNYVHTSHSTKANKTKWTVLYNVSPITYLTRWLSIYYPRKIIYAQKYELVGVIDRFFFQWQRKTNYKDNIGMTFNLIQCIDITLWKLCYIDQIPYLKYEINVLANSLLLYIST